jgi:anti-anti-sigma regulatory factor
MRLSARGNLIVETAKRGLQVMRFARPDLRQYLDDAADTATSPLFQEIQNAVLSDLPKGCTLVVNLGLIDTISAAFYRCLLHMRKCVQARHGRLVLCGFTPWHQEIFELFRGPELFSIVGTEAEARRAVRRGLSDPEPLRSRNSLRPLHSRQMHSVGAGSLIDTGNEPAKLAAGGGHILTLGPKPGPRPGCSTAWRRPRTTGPSTSCATRPRKRRFTPTAPSRTTGGSSARQGGRREDGEADGVPVERTTLKRNRRQGVLFVHDPVDSSAQVAERRLALSYLELVRFGFAS